MPFAASIRHQLNDEIEVCILRLIYLCSVDTLSCLDQSLKEREFWPSVQHPNSDNSRFFNRVFEF